MTSVAPGSTLASVASPPPLPVGRPARSVFVTVLAWVVIVASAILLPISVISLCMLLVGSYGTANASWLGAWGIVGVPPATLFAGIGLLRRWRWAYGYILVLLVVVVGMNVATMLRGSTPEHSYVSPGGVPTTVLASSVDYPFHVLIVAGALGLLAWLLTRSVRAEFGLGASPAVPAVAVTIAPRRAGTAAFPPLRDARAGLGRDWRVGHQGRDEMYYEEHRDGTWQRIRVSGEMLMGRAHHVIYFDSPQVWLNHPAWAQGRRDEIITRIKSEFRAPDYEYHGDGGVTAGASAPTGGNALIVPPSAPTPAPVVAVQAVAGVTTRSQWRALFAAVVIMLGIAGGMSWLVGHGLVEGETWLPSKRSSLQRLVVRAQEPVMFWVSLGIYAAVGAGSLGLAGWGVREGRRIARRERVGAQA